MAKINLFRRLQSRQGSMREMLLVALFFCVGLASLSRYLELYTGPGFDIIPAPMVGVEEEISRQLDCDSTWNTHAQLCQEQEEVVISGRNSEGAEVIKAPFSKLPNEYYVRILCGNSVGRERFKVQYADDAVEAGGAFRAVSQPRLPWRDLYLGRHSLCSK